MREFGRASAAAVAFASLSGCMVVDAPYPLEWDVLPAPAATHCRYLAGRYADRGQSSEHPGELTKQSSPAVQPSQTKQPSAPPRQGSVTEERSFTRELLGEDSPWQNALEFMVQTPSDDVAVFTVVDRNGSSVSRSFTVQSGQLECDAGRMILHNKRWVASTLLSGRENITMELQRGGDYLVAHVSERDTGLAFAVVPLSGESARWMRFRRLAP